MKANQRPLLVPYSIHDSHTVRTIQRNKKYLLKPRKLIDKINESKLARRKQTSIVNESSEDRFILNRATSLMNYLGLSSQVISNLTRPIDLNASFYVSFYLFLFLQRVDK